MDDYFPVGHRALSRVSLAVLLLDDLTGRQITGSNARAWIEKERPPIKKNDGWFVFTDLHSGCYTVNAEGGRFESCRKNIDITADSMQMLVIRLSPGRVYPVPPGCLRVEGKAEPHSEVTIVSCNKASGFKLLSDCRAGDCSVSVFHPEGVRLDGRAFRLGGGDGEDIVLSASEDPESGNGVYRLSEPLEYDHPRIGSTLMPAYSAVADENGRFFMILGAGVASSGLICESCGSSKLVKKYEDIDTHCFRPNLTEE